MQKLLIVDGSNLLFQMFYGMPARIVGKSGRPVHGTIGFVGALMKIIRMVRPTHAVVLFDGEHENPRAALDPRIRPTAWITAKWRRMTRRFPSWRTYTWRLISWV